MFSVAPLDSMTAVAPSVRRAIISIQVIPACLFPSGSKRPLTNVNGRTVAGAPRTTQASVRRLALQARNKANKEIKCWYVRTNRQLVTVLIMGTFHRALQEKCNTLSNRTPNPERRYPGRRETKRSHRIWERTPGIPCRCPKGSPADCNTSYKARSSTA